MSGNADPIVYTDITDLAKDLAEISGKSPEEITGNIFQTLGEEIVGKARARAPVRTGKLRDSISYQIVGNQLIVSPTVPYAPYMEFGTASRGEFNGAPYTIVPRTKPYLVFKVGDKWVYTKKVIHPGVAPRPFMRPAVQDAMGTLADKLAERGAMMIVRGPKNDSA